MSIYKLIEIRAMEVKRAKQSVKSYSLLLKIKYNQNLRNKEIKIGT